MRAKFINEILQADSNLFEQFKQIFFEVKDLDTNDPFYELNERLNPLNIFLIDFKNYFDSVDPEEKEHFSRANMVPELGIRICGFKIDHIILVVDETFDDKFIEISKFRLESILNKMWSSIGHETIHMQQVNKMKVKQDPTFKSEKEYFEDKQEIMAMAFSFIEEVKKFHSKEEILNMLRGQTKYIGPRLMYHPLLARYKEIGGKTYKMFTKYSYQYLMNDTNVKLF